ncbi:hypothetical protein CLOM_g15251, partial [Closterium sp. NIES-68]
MRARGKEGGGREELAVNPRNPRAGAIGDGAERLDHDDAEDGDDDDVSGGADSPPFRPPPPAAGGRRRGLVGVRAAFPASFGRQEQRVTPLEAVHARTARGPAETSGRAWRRGWAMARRQSWREQRGRNGARRGCGGGGGGGGGAEGGKGGAEAVGGGLRGAGGVAKGSTGAGDRPAGGGGGGRGALGAVGVEQEGGMESHGAGHAEIGPPPPPPHAPVEDRARALIGPPAPLLAAGSSRARKKGGGGGGGKEADEFGVPVSNEIVLGGHTKAVAALAVDPTGTRVISGSYDYSLHFYDFQGMDWRLKSFRQVLPFDGHQVRAVSFSPRPTCSSSPPATHRPRYTTATGAARASLCVGHVHPRPAQHQGAHSGAHGGAVAPVRAAHGIDGQRGWVAAHLGCEGLQDAEEGGEAEAGPPRAGAGDSSGVGSGWPHGGRWTQRRLAA